MSSHHRILEPYGRWHATIYRRKGTSTYYLPDHFFSASLAFHRYLWAHIIVSLERKIVENTSIYCLHHWPLDKGYFNFSNGVLKWALQDTLHGEILSLWLTGYPILTRTTAQNKKKILGYITIFFILEMSNNQVSEILVLSYLDISSHFLSVTVWTCNDSVWTMVCFVVLPLMFRNVCPTLTG